MGGGFAFTQYAGGTTQHKTRTGVYMLKSFHISNFRLFQNIEVEKLGRVNLVVGKNNAGKSAFIEAVVALC
ncbi:hypothetical protein DSM106972_069900 [Dulcicalothrix desertica PCC 7102]|uniref:Endonuclease GajA/Old nuclease/RecF-like AAA domain-containing protein n=1 Tax=Dulcicalothrix desertica PCC 7102 TaxID=232991 RepID=A0A433V4G4_9CYAN|nr:hypothetical protein DSM106972_069900 [Dulcicalothrix desertica PCC 7102]